MTDLFWPGDERADGVFSDAALLTTLAEVESQWLGVLVGTGLTPDGAADPLVDLLVPEDLGRITAGAEAGGNPVIPLVALLRERVEPRNPTAARWLHRGLTSQDVLDTALVLLLRDAVADLRRSIREQVRTLSGLAADHRETVMVARTLTQHAVPTTFGLKVGTWLTGVLDAADDLARLDFPVQAGGAAGTRAATTELLGSLPSGAPAADDLVGQLAGLLGLSDAPPWHTTRAPLTRIGDALVRTTDAWGRIANDVLTLSRPEIGELSEGAAGGSSTMPHKANPVLSVLVRRAALTTPQLAVTLHLAAAESVDERADGGWHVEWATLRTLVRRTVVAASQTSDLLSALRVHPDRMRATLAAAHDDVRAEQRSMTGLTGSEPTADYLGASGALVDRVLDRARRRLESEELH